MSDLSSTRLVTLAKVMLAAAALLVAVTVGAYFFVFGPLSGFSLSTSDGAWSNFGSYVGGVLGPGFAFLAFLGVVVTVWLQAKQFEHMRRQAQLEELQRVIATVSSTVDDLLGQPAGSGDNREVAAMAERTVFIVLSAAGTAALSSKPDYLVTAKDSTIIRSARDALLLQARSLVVELHQLVWCLQEYEREGGSPTVVAFYKRRFNAVVCWLDVIELLSSSIRIQEYFKPKELRQFLAEST